MAIVNPQKLVLLHPEFVSNVSSTDFPGHYPDQDLRWNLQSFKKNLVIKIHRLSPHSCQFDIIGVDASIANALRRIIIAEVPTIAVEDVFMWNNTSVISDEVIVHRLGLIPLNVDPSLIDTREDDASTDRNTIVFHLKVACTRRKSGDHGGSKPEDLYNNSNVFASALKWVPQGEQNSIFKHMPPGPKNPNILVAKLRPGQELDIEMHAVKGIGATHAKWSPVSVASYRLHPHIRIKGRIPPASVPKFAACFSPGVIGIRQDEQGQDEPYVNCARKESMSREVFRHKEFADKVELGRIRDWFLFNIESEGPYAPERLLIEAISVMRDKIAVVRKAVTDLEVTTAYSDVDMG